MNDLNEYIVTLRDFKDLDDFYDDMESVGGNLYIPERKVEVFARRPISRNTHYLLTEDEANSLANDPRVLSVSRTPHDLGFDIGPVWTQTSNYWSKASISTSNDLNWTLLRCYEGSNRLNWTSTLSPNQSGTVTINGSGKNVDVVIIDGHFNPLHPEFAVNSDGTGGSRVQQFNWFSLTPAVTGGSAGTYVYTPYTDTTERSNNNNHGCHVASSVCGNTLGWARDAKIYNIDPYSTNPNSFPSVNKFLYSYDYVREFHKTKAINPITGIKNPTIVNSSWATLQTTATTAISSITYRGNTILGPFSKSQLLSYGLYVNSSNIVEIMVSTSGLIADVQDAINDGIICVGAAGNSYTKIDNVDGIDYDNKVKLSNNAEYFYHRGCTPGSASTNICVGAVKTNSASPGVDSKVNFSNAGPRVNIFAPGVNIAGSVMNKVGNAINSVVDTRNSSFYKVKYQGTSMASPQVTGLLACWLETNPRAKQANALTFLNQTGKTGQIPNTSGGYTDNYDLQGAPDLYLTYVPQRQNTGNLYPKSNLSNRPTTGQVWPRPNIFRYGT